MNTLDQTEKKMKAGIEHLKDELKKIRTGNANPTMLEDVNVEVYGTKMKLRDLSSITTPEPRQLLVTPYDSNNSDTIGKGIEKANLGFQVIVDGNTIRIIIPQMDANVRQEMVKMCHKKREEAKISIRNIRRDSNETVRKQKTNGDIGEDMEKKLEKNIQELTDKFCKQADEISSTKEKEVSTV